jgi:hypothetical protein
VGSGTVPIKAGNRSKTMRNKKMAVIIILAKLSLFPESNILDYWDKKSKDVAFLHQVLKMKITGIVQSGCNSAIL